MNLKEYGTRAISTLTPNHDYGDISADLMAQVLGLVGESGEIAEKFKKIVRDKAGKLSDVDRTELAKELGDVLWYVNAVAILLGSDIETIATQNLEKLQSRKARGALHGSGDNR